MNDYVGKICPFCKTEIREGENVKECPACGIPHHEGCWEENHGCTTFGCAEQHYEAQNTNPTDVCANCGAPLGDGQAFCPKCGTPKAAAPQKNVCSKCGNELQDGQEFCPMCGYKAGLAMDASVSSAINQFNANVDNQKQKKKKKGMLPIIIGGAVVAVIALFLIFKGPSVDEIELSESSVTLKVDESINVTYTISPDRASDVDVKWESSNEAVATVTSSGKIVAEGEGTCTIKATAGGKSDTINVEVKAMSREEKKLLGTWHTVAMMDEYGDLSALPSYSGTFYAYDDFTGKMTASDTTLYFTWEYIKYEDGDYYYRLTLTEGGSFSFLITDLDGDASIVMPLDDIIVVYQK